MVSFQQNITTALGMRSRWESFIQKGLRFLLLSEVENIWHSGKRRYSMSECSSIGYMNE